MRSILLLFALTFAGNAAFGQSAEQLAQQGYEHYESAEYAKAVEFYTKAISLDSLNPDHYYLRGVCKSQLGNNEDAIGDYDLALKMDNSYAEVHYEKGYSYFLLGESEKAVAAFSKAIELNPNYAAAYFNRGSVKCIQGDKEGAKADWEEAKKLGSVIPDVEC